LIAFSSSTCRSLRTTGVDNERFINARAENYWTLRELFEAGDIDIDPDDDKLAAQLGAIKWSIDSRGRIKIGVNTWPRVENLVPVPVPVPVRATLPGVWPEPETRPWRHHVRGPNLCGLQLLRGQTRGGPEERGVVNPLGIVARMRSKPDPIETRAPNT
jgi:hypothetical protein